MSSKLGKISLAIMLFFSIFLLGACSQQKNTVEEKVQENQHEDTHWSYEGETGPENWGELDSKYAACVDGREQSPIDIIEKETTKVNKRNLTIHYKTADFSIINNGHSIQASGDNNTNYITLDKQKFELKQFHFHTPSEHQLNEKSYEMEVHFVHENNKGELAVIGLFIKEGNENKALKNLFSSLPKEEGSKVEETMNIAINEIVPDNQQSFQYKGSLTTPPCSEGVNWIVMKEAIEMSSQQINSFKTIFNDNHRPVQAVNNREVVEYE